jgi:PBP1b-binding outer membrane lipoprotein LpoB
MLIFVIASCGAMLFLAGCSSSPKRSSIRYSPPPVAPVQEKITHAQTAAASVSAAIAEAQALNKDEKVGHALGVAESAAKELKVDLVVAGDRLLLLDSSIRNQTDLLNAAIDEKNAAIIERDDAVSKYHKLKFFLCLLAAGVVLSLAWRFRGLLVFIPPPYNLVAIGALPVLVFGFLWIRF